LLGFPLPNVFELVNDDPNKYLPADEIEKPLGKEVNVLGYLVTTKPVCTIKNDTTYFHTFIDAKSDWLDVVCFPQIAIRYSVTAKGFYSLKGKVVEEFGILTVEVSYCKKVGIRDRGHLGGFIYLTFVVLLSIVVSHTCTVSSCFGRIPPYIYTLKIWQTKKHFQNDLDISHLEKKK